MTKSSTSAPKAETPNQKPANKKPKDKSVTKLKAVPRIPQLIVNASDPMLIETTEFYLRLCGMRPYGKNHIKKVKKFIVDLKAWQKANPDKVKY